MDHPHLSDSCELDTSDAELSCDNVPRFRGAQLKDDEETIAVTCMVQEHSIGIDDVPDDTLETLTRRLFVRGYSNRETERERFLEELDDRDVTVPDAPGEVEWFVVELSEAEVRELEAGPYPEAYQMSQSVEEPTSDKLALQEDEEPKAMKVSDWGLRNIPDGIAARAVPLSESDYDDSFFG